jgi:hypothetical protein
MYKKVSYLESEFISINRNCRAVPVKDPDLLETVPVSSFARADHVHSVPAVQLEISNDLMTAAQASAITVKANNKKQMNFVLNQIRISAEDGKASTKFGGLNNFEIDKLRQLGYVVCQSSDYGWCVCWR